MTLDNVPRIDPPGDAEFLERVLAPAQVVVIRDLYRNDPVGAIRTVADAAAAWGRIPVPVQLEYTTRDLIRRTPKRIDVTPLSQFLTRSPDDPETSKLVVIEQPTPAPMLRYFPPPSYATLGGATLDDMECKIFVAHTGHYAHMHYDLDGRAVLLTQVFGRKRVWVVSPERGQRLDPMTESIGHWSSLFIENLSPDDKLALARTIGAHDCILEPGDTIFIPTGWWHYVDYLETGMGFNIRIGRTAQQKALFAITQRLPPRLMHNWQGIAQLFATGRQPTADESAALDRLLAAFEASKGGQPAAVEQFGQLLVELHRRASPGGYRELFHRNDLIRSLPLDELAEPPPDPSQPPPPEPEWTADATVTLAPGIEVAQTIGRAAPELIVMRHGEPSWRIGAESAAEAYELVRAVLEQLSGEGAPVVVGELARRLACDPDELVSLLDELAETGAVVLG